MRPSTNVRESFGLAPAPRGSFVEVRYMGGAGYYILWESAPDGENILASHFSKKAHAEEYAERQGWNLCHTNT